MATSQAQAQVAGDKDYEYNDYRLEGRVFRGCRTWEGFLKGSAGVRRSRDDLENRNEVEE